MYLTISVSFLNIELFHWQNLSLGIQFLLGLQLVVAGVLHFIYKSNRSRIPLAFLCLIFGLGFFKSIFHSFWKDNLVLYVLIGPDKPIFIGPLLLFYYKSYSTNLKIRYVVKHLLIPVLFYFILMIFRLYYPKLFPNFTNNQIPIFYIAALLIFWYYFLITRKELRLNVKQKLIPKAYKKVVFLFYSLYFFLLQIPIWDMYNELVHSSFLPAEIALKANALYNNLFKYIGEDLSYTYFHLLAYFLFLYAISELIFLKRFFLPKNALMSASIFKSKSKIDELIDYYFINKKLFKDPELTLESCAKIFDIPKKELMEYLKLTNRGVFKDFVNSMRVEELKLNLKREEFKRYDLVGLAKECGFKSRSTFFRVFKNFEGVTPNEYKKLMD